MELPSAIAFPFSRSTAGRGTWARADGLLAEVSGHRQRRRHLLRLLVPGLKLLGGVAELPGHPVEGVDDVAGALAPLRDHAAELRSGGGDHGGGGELVSGLEHARDDRADLADRVLELALGLEGHVDLVR